MAGLSPAWQASTGFCKVSWSNVTLTIGVRESTDHTSGSTQGKAGHNRIPGHDGILLYLISRDNE